MSLSHQPNTIMISYKTCKSLKCADRFRFKIILIKFEVGRQHQRLKLSADILWWRWRRWWRRWGWRRWWRWWWRWWWCLLNFCNFLATTGETQTQCNYNKNGNTKKSLHSTSRSYWGDNLNVNFHCNLRLIYPNKQH